MSDGDEQRGADGGRDGDRSSPLAADGRDRTPLDPLLGTVFGSKYRIVEKIGAGGMGGVYRAEHLLMNRHVALKLLRPNLLEDEVFQKRFQNEAKAASQISHPNAVTLFDFGVEEGVPYLVMEYIHGRTLKQLLLDERPLSLSRVSNILRQVADALHAAHRLGIVHRDIKPDNFMVRTDADGDEIAKVLDFGIAKSVGPSDLHPESNLTQVGMLVGTPQYMSPEQCQGKQLDTRCDIYSLGIVVYEMLTGEPPFRAPSVLELLVRVLNSPAESMRVFKPLLHIPAEVDQVVLKSLEKDPAKRYGTMLEFSRAFQEAIDLSKPKPPPDRSRKFLWVGTGAALVLVTGLTMSRGTAPVPPTNSELEEHAKQATENARRVEAEKQQLIKQAQEMKVEVERREAADERLRQAQAVATKKSDEEQQRALQAAEAARVAAERQSAESEKKQLAERLAAEKQAALERAAALKQQEEAAKRAEAEKLAAMKQVEVARAEAARLGEAAKKMEEEKATLVKMMQESEKRSAEKLAAERAAAEKATAERIAAEKVAAERAAAEKVANERAAAMKTVAERIAAEKQAQERVAAEKIAAEKVAAEKVATEKVAKETKLAEDRAKVARSPEGRAEAERRARERTAREARLNETIRQANAQRGEALQRAESMKIEAAKQERALRDAQERTLRLQREADARNRREAARPTPKPTSEPVPNEEATPTTKQRRRCGPTWCM